MAIHNVADVNIGPEYGYCLLVCVVIGFQCIFEGVFVGGARRKYFGKHKDVPNGGYPDTGSGRYAQKFTDAEWLSFNNVMRVHQNYVEGIASVLIFELVSGLFFPTFAASMGAVYILGRAIYGIGYRATGPKGRMYGAALFDIAILALFASAIYGCLQMTGLLGSLGF